MGLAKGLATVRIATTVPVSGICSGPGNGLGNVANRDYSSGFRHLVRAWQGLGNGANRDYSQVSAQGGAGPQRARAQERSLCVLNVEIHIVMQLRFPIFVPYS